MRLIDYCEEDGGIRDIVKFLVSISDVWFLQIVEEVIINLYRFET